MAYGASLECWFGRKTIVGSTPTLSACAPYGASVDKSAVTPGASTDKSTDKFEYGICLFSKIINQEENQ